MARTFRAVSSFISMSSKQLRRKANGRISRKQHELTRIERSEREKKKIIACLYTLKKSKIHKKAALYPSEPYICTKEKQTLRQCTCGEDYYHKKKENSTRIT